VRIADKGSTATPPTFGGQDMMQIAGSLTSPPAMDTNTLIAALSAVALAGVASRVTLEVPGAVVLYGWRPGAVVMGTLGVSILLVVIVGRSSRLLSEKRATAAKRCRSHSDFSFSLGEPEAPFLRVPEQQMPRFEAEIGSIYAVYDQSSCDRINLRTPLYTLRKLLAPYEQEHWQLREPIDDVLLCRTLVAKDFNVEKAFALVKGYLEWRVEVDGGVRPPDEWIATCHCSIPFEDRFGRPVVVVRSKYIDGSMPAELLQKGYRATVDAVISHLLEKRSSTVSGNNPLEQYVLCFESEGAGWSNFSPQIVKIMVAESNKHYPERLAGIFVLNSTHFVRSCFNMVSWMLHPRTVKKVQFLTQDKVAAFMQNLVDIDKLPPEYGGHAPSWPGPDEAKSLNERMGPIMAGTYRRLGLAPPGQEADEQEVKRTTSDDIPRNTGADGCCWRAW